MTEPVGLALPCTRTAHRSHGRVRACARTAAVLLAGVVVLAGCTDDSDPGLDLQTPTTSATSQSPTSGDTPTQTPTVTAEEQAVLDAYQAFYAGLTQAYADPVHSQDYLAPVATGAQFEFSNGGIKANLLAGEETVGEAVLEPEVASIEGETAVVHDCQDTTAVIRRKIGTTDPLVIGRDPDSAETTLQMVDGVWKVADSVYQTDPAVFCG